MTVVVQEPITTVVETTGTEVVVTTEAVTETIEVGISGPQGATGAVGAPGEDGDDGVDGDTGPQGPPGSSGGQYEHTQAVPSTTWTVIHNLGYRPGGILVLDTLGRVSLGEVSYPDVNTVRISFSAAFSGSAFIS